MKCDTAQARLVAFLLGESSGWESNRIASHVGKCPSCFEELDSLHLTITLLQRLPEERLSPSFDRKLAERLASLRALDEKARPGARKPASRGLRWIAVGGAALAGIALILALAVPRPSSVEPRSRVASRAAAAPRSARRADAFPRGGEVHPSIATPLASAAASKKRLPQVAAVVPLAKIVGIAGEPRLRALGEKTWRVCRKEDAIPGAAALMTAETDRAEIELGDGSRISVDYDTHLEIARATEAGPGARSAQLYLRSGNIWLLLTRAQAGMVVYTPTARAEALGTLFSLSVERRSRPAYQRLEERQPGTGLETTIAVIRGKVELSNRHGKITVGQGGFARAATGEPAAPSDAAERVNAIRLQVPWGRRGFIDWTLDKLSWAEAVEKLAGRRARLGVELEPAPVADASQRNGLSVLRVLSGSPAEHAGVRQGDRLLRLGDLTIGSKEDLARSELLFPPGHQVNLVVERNGEVMQLTAAPDEHDLYSPEVGNVALEKANRDFATNNMAAAMRAYQDMIERGEQKAAAFNNLGVVHELGDRADDAIVAYGDAVRLSPKVARYRFNLAMAFVRIENLPRAAQELEAAVANDPESTTARFQLGKTLALCGEYEAAAEQARFLQLSPAATAHGHCLMGEIFMLRGDAKEAESWYLKAAQADPLYLDPHIHLARACFVQRRTDEAQQWAESALKLAPTSLTALNGLGLILLRRGRLQEAEQVFLKAAALHPGSGKVYNNLGLLYLSKRELAASEAAYRTAVTVAPDATWCHYGLAVTLERRDRFDEAKKEYAVALRLDPAYEPAYWSLASLQRRLGEVQLAQNTLAKARQYGL